MGAGNRAVVPVLLAVVVVTAGCSVLGGGDATPADATATATDADRTATTAPTTTGTAATTTGETAEGTVTATATPTATPTPTPPPTPTPTAVVTGDSGIVVVEIQADPPGDDAENLHEEYIVIKNTGDLPVDLGGWRVTDADGNVYTFDEGIRLGIGETLTLHTGSGLQSETDRYWLAEQPVWDNNRDRIYIYDAGGQKEFERPYDR